MDSIKSIIGNKYRNNNDNLEYSFNEALKDETFKKVVSTIKLPKKEIMKHTSKIEDTVLELKNCSNCQNIFECKNSVSGYVYYPSSINDSLVFSYVPCKYKKELDKKNKYQENISVYDMPSTIKSASMKDIYTDDSDRFPVIKWLKKFIDEYKKGNTTKGLYLTGNFGCGKTYLISAMLNELAKVGKKVCIIYYPEFLRSLKETFNDDDEYRNRFNYIKTVELLLIDDIGAETTTSWSRDEILGTILQYRMQAKLPTFFTSNFTIQELEEHLSLANNSIEKVKARRIIERIKQLSEIIVMISENKRK